LALKWNPIQAEEYSESIMLYREDSSLANLDLKLAYFEKKQLYDYE
jgi:hypothetical protein